MKDKIRVLHMVPLGAGGITTMVLNFAQQFRDSDIQIDYLTFKDRHEYNEDRALSYGGKKYVVPTDHYSNPFVRALFKFFNAIKVIRKSGADVVHVNASFPYDIMVGLSAKIAGAKVVFHSHNSQMRQDKSIRGRMMPVFKFFIPMVSDVYLACSESAAEFMFPNKILKSKRYSILHNAVSLNKFHFEQELRANIRSKLAIESKLVIGHVGRFTTQKNHEFLLQIFEAVHERRPDSVLLLLGEGEFFSKIQNMTEEMGLRDNVIFYGATQKIPALLSAMDCFVMPSLFEGLPFSAVEAQASGLPCFFSNAITQELSLTPLAHFLSLSDFPSVWADAILRTLNDNPERKTWDDEITAHGYNLASSVEKINSIYRELIS